jgi:hypothetical protein
LNVTYCDYHGGDDGGSAGGNNGGDKSSGSGVIGRAKNKRARERSKGGKARIANWGEKRRTMHA